jgi:hypothetical protein
LIARSFLFGDPDETLEAEKPEFGYDKTPRTPGYVAQVSFQLQ